MAVKIRLQRKGRKKAPFYFIVVADARSPRDGRFIEKIGTYNPLTVPATIHLDNERAFAWLNNGAQPSDTVRAILRYKGVLYQKHLALGVRKGALSEEQAAAELARFIEQKETNVAKRREAVIEKKKAHRAAVDGSPKAKPKPAPVAATEEAADAVETAEPAETAEMVAAAETIETVESAEVTDVVETEETVETPEVTDVVETAETVETPEIMAAGDVVETEETVETAEVTDAGDVVETEETVETPEVTDAGDVVETEETVETEVPEATEETPEKPAEEKTGE